MSCQVQDCDVAAAKYTCPRCATRFCSVACYARHSTSCAAHLAQDEHAQWKGVRVTEEQRRRFNALLQRMRRDDRVAVFLPPDEGASQPLSLSSRGHGRGDDGLDVDEDDVDEDDVDEDKDDEDNDDEDNDDEDNDDEDNDDEDNDDEDDDDGDVSALLADLAGELPPSAQCVLSSVLRAGRDPANESLPPAPPQGAVQQDDTMADELEHLAEDMRTQRLTYDEILARLPRDLANDFHAQLRSGKVSHLLPAVVPWWQHGQDHEHDADTDDDDDDDGNSPKRAATPPLPTAAQLHITVDAARNRAHATLVHNVVDVLIAYIYATRLSQATCDYTAQAEPDQAEPDDTSHASVTLQMAQGMVQASDVLRVDARRDNATEACREAFNKLSAVAHPRVASSVLRDAASVLGLCGAAVARALYDTQTTFALAKHTAHSGDEALFGRCERKVSFFVAWALGESSASFRMAARHILAFVDDVECPEIGVAKSAASFLRIDEQQSAFN